MLRAGFTEVFVTGIETRWIKVSAKPMAIGAKPAGALPCVEPMMTNRNMAVSTNSATKAETRPYLPGECSPYPLAANPLPDRSRARHWR